MILLRSFLAGTAFTLAAGAACAQPQPAATAASAAPQAAAAAASAPPQPLATDVSGAELYGLVQAFAAIGDHRTGTPGDARTQDWFADALHQAGAQIARESFDFPRYDAHAEVRVDGHDVAAMPLYYQGTGDIDDDHPYVAAETVVDKDTGSAQLADAIAKAQAAGAKVAVIATTNALGALQVPNRETAVSPGGLAVVLVPGSTAEALRKGPVHVHVSAHVVDGSSTDVIASFGDVAHRPIVIATPLSCWFACAGERGTGVAVAIALARHVAPRYPVLVVGTPGHELLPHIGLQAFLQSHRIDPVLVVHLGSSVGAGERQSDGSIAWGDKRVVGLRMPLPVVGRLVPSLKVMHVKPYPNPKQWIGEGEAWAQATHAMMMSFVGAGPEFHTPADLPEATTSPALMLEAYQGVAGAVDAWLQVAPMALLATLKPEPTNYTADQIAQVVEKAGDHDCFWTGMVSPKTFNVLYPDDGVTYWSAHYHLPDGAKLTLDGKFPHARYMSINAYNGDGAPVDRIIDSLVAPEPGSTNPFRVGASRAAEPRAYRLQVVEHELAAGQMIEDAQRAPNTLYVPKGDASMELVYRIYVADAGKGAMGGEPLPRPTLTLADGEKVTGQALCKAITLRDSAVRDMKVPAEPLKEMFQLPSKAAHPPAQPDPHWNAFFNPTLGIANLFIGTPFEAVRHHLDTTRKGGFYGTLDNIYLSMYIDDRYGDVFVLHGKAPTTPRTLHGNAEMEDGDLRYWSFCKYRSLADTAVDQCLFDEQVPRDAEGDYTVVISQPDKRPSNAKAACGVAWMPWGTGDSLGSPDGGFLLWRQMKPSAGFRPHSAFATSKPGDEAEVLGPYYPQPSYMSKADFEKRGCSPH